MRDYPASIQAAVAGALKPMSHHERRIHHFIEELAPLVRAFLDRCDEGSAEIAVLETRTLVGAAAESLRTGQGLERGDIEHFLASAAPRIGLLVREEVRAAKLRREAAAIVSSAGTSPAAAPVLVASAPSQPGRKLSPQDILVRWPDGIDGDAFDPEAIRTPLERLKSVSPERGLIAEMRCHAGLSCAEVGRVLGMSTRDATLEWRAARQWLRAEIGSVGRRVGPKGGSQRRG